MPDPLRLVAAAAALALAPGPAPAQTCAAPPYAGVDDPVLSAALATLARYPSLDAALRQVGPDLCRVDGVFGAMGYFEPAANRVVVDAALDPGLQRAVLFHELRHVDQFARGVCPDLSLAMQAYARATWALEADAATISLIIAWDLRAGGDPAPWDALAALPRYAAMTDAFAAQMEAGAGLPDAGAAAFTSWYANAERLRDYYIAGCSTYLDEQDRTRLLPQYGGIGGAYFARLCVLPDGSGYPCAEPPLD
ncbi:DUF6782 family putative metallopeptidase [Roseicyclus persicicus]|uniref:DUF6782 domain-containing protein n=1 Tax=Roseicyclus persicicus TaxID=2650661 RepID=A0A7X6GZK3_9RHOB|nr:DUF6782 family putative metallopeptidase [Roseibacterium persicicum]NKX45294.1 hypothetical protein [Roseibacterium persicicum]